MKVCDWREGWTARSFHSHAALRVLAFGQNLRRLRFTAFRRRLSNPLRGFSDPSLPIETKTRPLGLVLVSRRERDSNPRTCDSLRISRPAQSTTLASLQGSHNLVKISRFVYPRPHDRSSPARFLFLTPFETACRISTFGRESKKRIQQNFRFISASALRGFSRFGRATGARTIR